MLALELALGGGLGVWGIADTWRLAGHEPSYVALYRGGTCVCLLLLTGAYLALWRRAVPARATLFYPVSYAVLGIVISGAIRGWAKDFAPALPGELPGIYVVEGLQLAVAVVMSALLFRDAARAASRLQLQG